MKNFSFWLLALATWRIANMLVNEEGPWLVFERLRLAAGLRPALHPDWKRETEPPGRMPGSLFACVWCMSMWVAIWWAALWLWRRRLAQALALPFALSALACLLDEWGHR